jgi:predicted nuclease of predicted toxin-antitoxin system
MRSSPLRWRLGSRIASGAGFLRQVPGYRDAEDPEIFRAAREAGAVVMTKDSDFLDLLEQHGPPPQVLWVTLGNTSNARMRVVLERNFLRAATLLQSGEALVEIRDEA